MEPLVPSLTGQQTLPAPVDPVPEAQPLDGNTGQAGSIRHGIANAKVGSRIYEDLSLPLKAVRDMMRANVRAIRENHVVGDAPMLVSSESCSSIPPTTRAARASA